MCKDWQCAFKSANCSGMVFDDKKRGTVIGAMDSCYLLPKRIYHSNFATNPTNQR